METEPEPLPEEPLPEPPLPEGTAIWTDELGFHAITWDADDVKVYGAPEEPEPLLPDPGAPDAGSSWIDWLIVALMVAALVTMLVLAAAL